MTHIKESVNVNCCYEGISSSFSGATSGGSKGLCWLTWTINNSALSPTTIWRKQCTSYFSWTFKASFLYKICQSPLVLWNPLFVTPSWFSMMDTPLQCLPLYAIWASLRLEGKDAGSWHQARRDLKRKLAVGIRPIEVFKKLSFRSGLSALNKRCTCPVGT